MWIYIYIVIKTNIYNIEPIIYYIYNVYKYTLIYLLRAIAYYYSPSSLLLFMVKFLFWITCYMVRILS